MSGHNPLNSILNLSGLGRGETAIILGVHGSDSIRHRLQAMGLRTGREAEVIRCPRLGPMQIRIGSINLIMRRSDAARVSISL
ncbi:MAG: FeoA family protein [Gammaproteobacteria bacterium]